LFFTASLSTVTLLNAINESIGGTPPNSSPSLPIVPDTKVPIDASIVPVPPALIAVP
jgi:hypothetical protein